MSVLESTHLRDLLRVRDNNNEDDGRDSLAGLTLAAVLGCETSSSTSNHIRREASSRTLLEIIKDEESGAAYRGLIVPPLQNNNHNNININDDDNGNNKNSWKYFKSRLRLRRAGAAFSSSTSSHPVSACDFSIQDCNIRISPPVLVEHRPRILRIPTFANGRSSNSIENSPRNEGGGIESVSRSTGNSISLAESLAREREEQRPAREEVGSNLIENVVESRLLREEMELNLTESPVEETLPAREEMRAEEMRVSLNENPVVEVRNEAVAAEVVVAPPRVSLMALLEETDWSTGGIVGTTEMEIDDEVEEEKKDNKVEGKEGGRGEYVCCVCMVRHKGAAFIPCGHTFCRLCSRELWVNRGNCPLCNGFILEILDIF